MQASPILELRLRPARNKLRKKEDFNRHAKSGPAEAGLAGPAAAPLERRKGGIICSSRVDWKRKRANFAPQEEEVSDCNQ